MENGPNGHTRPYRRVLVAVVVAALAAGGCLDADGPGTLEEGPTDASDTLAAVDSGADARDLEVGPADVRPDTVPDGTTDVTPDGEPVDPPSSKPPSSPGQLVVTEFMADPKGSDGRRAWFEVYNASSSALNLEDCKLKDSGSDRHQIATKLVVRSGDHLIFSRGQNPGFEPDYVYGGSWYLTNQDADEIILSCAGTVIDRMEYGTGRGFPSVQAGVSLQLSRDARDATSNDAGANWCASTAGYGRRSERGTPGSKNAPCS